jgi:hypothetical protein
MQRTVSSVEMQGAKVDVGNGEIQGKVSAFDLGIGVISASLKTHTLLNMN